MSKRKPSEMESLYEKSNDFSIFYNMRSHVMGFVVLLNLGDGDYEMEDCTFTKDPDDALVFMNGYLKRDGCCDLTIGSGDAHQLHFCDMDDAKRVGRVFDKLYELCRDQMASFDAETAE